VNGPGLTRHTNVRFLTQSAHSASAVQPVELLGLLAKLLGIPVFAGRNGCLRFYATPAQ
jgi:hypothetical protein